MEIETPTGDILDKIVIMSLKITAMTDKDQLTNVWKELLYLDEVISSNLDSDLFHSEEVQELLTRLSAINNIIWLKNVEARGIEESKVFGEPFIELCRGKMRLEDERDALKRELSEIFPSNFIEEKTFDEIPKWNPSQEEDGQDE
jgi:hypothetical protein